MSALCIPECTGHGCGHCMCVHGSMSGCVPMRHACKYKHFYSVFTMDQVIVEFSQLFKKKRSSIYPLLDGFS
jgi:hypothetical protein